MPTDKNPRKVTRNVTAMVPPPTGEEQDWDAPGSPFRVEEEEVLDVPMDLEDRLEAAFLKATGRPLSPP